MHVPKTAGSSLRDALLARASRGETLLVYPGDELGLTYEECLALPSAQLRRCRWIYGHHKTGPHHHLGGPARYVTFIRNSAARLRSNVAHHDAAGTTFTVAGHRVEPADYIMDGRGEEFDNLMTRTIAGVTPNDIPLGKVDGDLVARAVENVRSVFSFVGQQESLDTDTRALQELAGLPLRPPRRANVTPARSRYGPDFAAAIDWAELAHRNRFDAMLHAKLLALRLVSRPLR